MYITQKITMNNEEQKIIAVITALFHGADTHDWKKVQQAMAHQVLLDYTSISGGSPSVLTPQQITESWAAFLPIFDKTHHQLSAIQVTVNSDVASANYVGKADHFIGTDVWTVDGSYETALQKVDGEWKITKQKFNLTSQRGELYLPAAATERMKNKTTKR